MASRSRRPRLPRQVKSAALALWAAAYQFVTVILEAGATHTTANTFASTYQDLGAGFGAHKGGAGFVAIVEANAFDTSDGNENYKFHVEQSPDHSTWSTCGPVVGFDNNTGNGPAGCFTANLDGTATFYVGAVVSQRYVRLVCVITGTTPSIVYSATLRPIR